MGVKRKSKGDVPVPVVEESLPTFKEAQSDDEDIMDSDESEEEVVKTEDQSAPKKLKVDVTKEAEKELKVYDEIIQDSDVKFVEKLSKLSGYLTSIFENNVNTLQFENNFNEWMKGVILKLLEEGTVASVEFYEFLCNVLKVSPTIIEPVCEKMLNFVFLRHKFEDESNSGFENFMESLSYTFEKLRRFPKLIAKFLCCVRENVSGVDQNVSKKFMKKMLGYKAKGQIVFVLPKRFLDSFASIVSLLPTGQIMDLWKTLHHNLEEECINKLDKGGDSVASFFTVVVELIEIFLCNIKVFDYAVLEATVDKVVDMMTKLKDSSIANLANFIPSKNNADLNRCFLKLCNAWGFVNHFLYIYKEIDPSVSFDNCGQQAMDLSVLLPQVSEDIWQKLWTSSEKSNDDTCTALMLNLVALKLKYLGLLEQRLTESQESNNDDSRQLIMKECAIFIWNHQSKLEDKSISSSMNAEIMRIASAYLPQDELLVYARTLLDAKLSSDQSNTGTMFHRQLSSNMKFQVAFVLELFHEGVKQIEKGSLKKQAKKFSSNCFSTASKAKIIHCLQESEKTSSLDQELKNALIEAVEIVNGLITRTDKENSDNLISADVYRQIMSFISHEELAQYPKLVKTVAFLSTLMIFSTVIKNKDFEDVTDDLSYILSECGRDAQGNDILFRVKWVDLFELIRGNIRHLSDKAVSNLVSLSFENIYISPKIASDFGEQYIQTACDDFDLTSAEGSLLVRVLDNILTVGLRQKTKSEKAENRTKSVLTEHAKTICSMILKKLSEGPIIVYLHSQINKKSRKKSLTTSPKDIEDVPKPQTSVILLASYLLLKGKMYLGSEEASEIAVTILPYLQFALDYLEHNHNRTHCIESIKGELTYCKLFILEAAKTFEEYREKLPQNFLLRLWNSMSELTQIDTKESENQGNIELCRQILEKSNEEEFQSISDSIIKKLDTRKQSAKIANILSVLIAAEIPSENKKHARRAAIESSLYKYLDHVQCWKDSEDFLDLAVPYLQFQTVLLKRRKPMGSLSTLSICLTSITSVPLDRVETIESFKMIFSLVCDLLNAFIVHRLDVLAFRSHVFLQCFQYLVESLVRRADQKNKLTDREIYHLRHCAHCIERICQSAKTGRDELARVSPYLIVVLLGQFEKTTVYPLVKNPLSNGCYKLLDICNEHGVAHVNSMLSLGSREIFKSLYELYKKFYQYKGKV